MAKAFVLALATLVSGCRGDQDVIVRSNDSTVIQLVTDSGTVRRLISHEEAVEDAVLDSWQKSSTPENSQQQLKDATEHPERYTPGRSRFISAMQEQPAVVVRGPAHVKILNTSLASCGPSPFAADMYVEVRVKEGPGRGREDWLCSDKIDVNDARTNDIESMDRAVPPIKTTLCELVTHPDPYIGRVVEIRAKVESGFEVSLLTDTACSARIWFDTASANLDEEHYRRMDAYLRNNNGVATVVGRFNHVGMLRWLNGNGFGHLANWQSELVMLSYKGT